MYLLPLTTFSFCVSLLVFLVGEQQIKGIGVLLRIYCLSLCLLHTRWVICCVCSIQRIIDLVGCPDLFLFDLFGSKVFLTFVALVRIPCFSY